MSGPAVAIVMFCTSLTSFIPAKVTCVNTLSACVMARAKANSRRETIYDSDVIDCLSRFKWEK